MGQFQDLVKGVQVWTWITVYLEKLLSSSYWQSNAMKSMIPVNN